MGTLLRCDKEYECSRLMLQIHDKFDRNVIMTNYNLLGAILRINTTRNNFRRWYNAAIIGSKQDKSWANGFSPVQVCKTAVLDGARFSRRSRIDPPWNTPTSTERKGATLIAFLQLRDVFVHNAWRIIKPFLLHSRVRWIDASPPHRSWLTPARCMVRKPQVRINRVCHDAHIETRCSQTMCAILRKYGNKKFESKYGNPKLNNRHNHILAKTTWILP